MISKLYQKYLNKFNQPVTRKLLARWAGWFFGTNTFVILLVSLRYFSVVDIPTQWPALLFSVIAFIGHFAFLTFLGFIILLPFILLLPNRLFVTALASALAVILVVGIILDTFVFEQYRFHLNSMVFSLVFGGAGDEIFHFSTTLWLIALGGILAVVAVEWILARLLWRWLDYPSPRWLGPGFAASLIMIFLAQNVAFAWADAKAYIPVTKQIRYLPGYFPLTAKSFFGKFGMVAKPNKAGTVLSNNNVNVDYPKKPLQCTGNSTTPNVILIVLDSWRADKLTTEVTPNIADFAKDSLKFTNHFSGANSTRVGIFTIFYGLVGTYWHAMLAENRGAAYINELLKQNYKLGIYASAKLTSPEFDRTVFSRVKNLRTHSKGSSPHERDRNITDEFKQFIDTVKDNSQPFFGFLFYDSPHAYDFPKGMPLKFKPSLDNVNYFKLDREFDPTPFINRYKNAVYYTDSLVGEVLQKIKVSGILKNTVVIITADHGQEFNDNGRNFWGHDSDFSEYQTKVPMVVRWPDKQPQTFNHLTSHFDIVPTLMQDILGCKNKIADYAMGKNLLDTKTPTPYLILSSYNQYAIKRLDKITVVDSFGQIDSYSGNYIPDNNVKLPPNLIVKVMNQMSYFYKKK